MAVFRVIPFCENTIPLFINYKILTIKVLYQKIPQKFPLFCDSMARPLSCLAIAGIKMNICERERSVSKLLKLLATCEQEKTLKTGCFKGFCVFCGLVGTKLNTYKSLNINQLKHYVLPLLLITFYFINNNH